MTRFRTKLPAVNSMRGRFMRALVMLGLGVCLALGAQAQEGHPIKGSWIGVWESNTTHGDDIIVILDWDGQRITGIINPGTDNIDIDRATLDPEGWVVNIEADAEDGEGRALRYRIEGRIQDLELPNRSIVGTWRNESGTGAFEIRRQ